MFEIELIFYMVQLKSVYNQLMKKIALLIVLATTTSCATIMTGHTDYIAVTSNPPGANFISNSGGSGVTPGGITVNEKEDVVIMFSKEGYEDISASVLSRTSGWALGNILIGGIIGFIIDVASDGMATHDDSVFVDMRKEGEVQEFLLRVLKDLDWQELERRLVERRLGDDGATL